MADQIPYSLQPDRVVHVEGHDIHSFSGSGAFRHGPTIASFGEEWKKFDRFTEEDIRIAGDEYFDVLPASILTRSMNVLDLGCGSGRWTRYLSEKVGHIDAVDPSEAIFTAARTHKDLKNVRWTHAGIDPLPFHNGTFDLIICLGVLHHVPDTDEALRTLVRKAKVGGHVLIYLYYALDGRGRIYKAIFRSTELLRKVIAALPGPIKRITCELIAFFIYLPLRTIVRLARKIDRRRRWWHLLPLSYYHNKSMRILRNDALDRFGTPLGQRFTRTMIDSMMHDAGLTDLCFSPDPPYWHVVGRRK